MSFRRRGPDSFKKATAGKVMLTTLKKFSTNEDGAVTVDWVVLTAAVVGFGAIAYLTLAEAFRHIDSETGAALSSVNVPQIELY